MKATKLTLLALGLFCLTSVYSFTLFNLPYDEPGITTDNPPDFTNTEEILEVVKTDNTNVETANFEDTILIDLDERQLFNAFPSSSRNCILSQVPYPEFAKRKQLEGGVAVRFAFDADGNIHVDEAFSSSKELEEYVIDRLSNMRLKNCVVDVDKDYFMRFMFKML